VSLEVVDVGKRYLPPRRLLRLVARVASDEPVDAVRDVSFGVAPGEIVGLVGPNGAGKTTLLKIIATLLEPSTGTVLVNGFDTVRSAHDARSRLGLVLTDDRATYWRLTGRQNLEFFGVLAGLTRSAARQRADELLAHVGLADRDKRVMGYSSGMRSALNLARAVMTEPAVLVLDEPTRSLDPLASAATCDLLREQAKKGSAVLLSSHRIDEVAALCDRVVVLLAGSVRYVGPPDPDERGDAAVRLFEMLADDRSVA
jgi:ABC-2 type transport system ATP-binding protein